MKRILFALYVLIYSTQIQAQENQKNAKQKDSTSTLKEVVINASKILGSKFEAENRTGSASYISPEDLKKFNYTDVNRILRTVPGVNVFEEDGYGLRPNISLRGTSAERSSKITLMEDGVLIAPAPYSAPAAYYVPSLARMNAVEILKGSSQIQYGPFTTGGAINFLSTPVSNKFSGSIISDYGSFNTSRTNASIGVADKNVGVLVQYLNFNSDGFKNLLNDQNTGFDKNDFMAKLHLTTDTDKRVINSLDLKIQYADEDANETYLGLTQADYDKNPFTRYASSQKDNITTKNNHIAITHTLKVDKYFSLTTTAYRNSFSRNWYKLDAVTFGGTKKGITEILENPETLSDYYAIVTGETNGANNSLSVKANNRNYLSQGIQIKFDYHFTTGNVFHDLEIGARLHKDEEDRFQWVDGYNIISNQMNLTSSGSRGSDDNRVASAKALALHIQYKLKYNKLTVTPGLRFETIDLWNQNYGKVDPTRTGANLVENDNHVKVWLPGIGANYKWNNNLSVFAGAHKGFAPPTNRTGQDAESSINYELGTRFRVKKLYAEIVGFYNDYSNMLGSDLAASGGSGTLDQFNAGEVRVNGVEVLLNYNVLAETSKFKVPVTFSYTMTNTEFLNDFASTDGTWGTISKGDEIPYISKHQFQSSIGVEHEKFEATISGRLNGKFRTQAGKGSIPSNELVPNSFVVDFAAKYNLNKHIGIIGNINNVFDTTYLVSRVPAGLRPGMPFFASAGLVAQF
ncbi:MAG TPA: TonB-dependent receptor [Flavobacterium sp.]|nr:TonB-dependent receptor [Flavobacterium sp.]